MTVLKESSFGKLSLRAKRSNLKLRTQNKKTGFIPDFRLSQSTSVSSGKDLPFWMVSNQNGVSILQNSSYLLFQAGLSRSLERDTLKKWGYTYGANMVYGYAGASDFHPNEYWLGFRFHQMILKAWS